MKRPREPSMEKLNAQFTQLANLSSAASGPRIPAVLKSPVISTEDEHSSSFRTLRSYANSCPSSLASTPDDCFRGTRASASGVEIHETRRAWSTHLREDSDAMQTSGTYPTPAAILLSNVTTLPSVLEAAACRGSPGCGASTSGDSTSFDSSSGTPLVPPAPPRATPRSHAGSLVNAAGAELVLSPQVRSSGAAMGGEARARQPPVRVAAANAPRRVACLSGLSALATAGSRGAR